MKTMAITDRANRDSGLLGRLLEAFHRAGPDAVQVRDRAGADRDVLDRLRRVRLALPEVRLFANARFDLALAAAADGVVLPADGLPVAEVRRETPRNFLVGRSTHSAAEVAEAFDAGADVAILGPIFDTPSKKAFGPPLGPDSLDPLPGARPPGRELYLVGGIDLDTVRKLDRYRGRFDGVAAIRLFEDSEDPAGAVRALADR